MPEESYEDQQDKSWNAAYNNMGHDDLPQEGLLYDFNERITYLEKQDIVNSMDQGHDDTVKEESEYVSHSDPDDIEKDLGKPWDITKEDLDRFMDLLPGEWVLTLTRK